MPAQTKKINLLPTQVLEEHRLTRFLHWSLTYGRYITIITEFIVLAAFFSRFKLDQELTDLHESISQKQAIIQSVKSFEQNVRTLQNRITAIKQIDTHSTLYVNTLQFLEEVVPRDVLLTRLEFTKNTVQISATAYSNSGFAQIVRNLRSAPTVRNLSIDSIDKPEGLASGLAFQMSFEIIQ